MASKERKEHYVSPEDFKRELRQYYDTDVCPEILAVYLMKIANGLSHSPNFKNYSYREDMVSDAQLKMYKALKEKKFRFECASNPFSYFTTIAFNAFINRIKKEKKNHETIKNYKEFKYEELMASGDIDIYVRPVHEDE